MDCLPHCCAPRALLRPAAQQVPFESGLARGDVWVLDQLWRELGFDDLAAVFRRARYTAPVEQVIRVMVFNRLCGPDSKLGVLRWLQTERLRGVDAGQRSRIQHFCAAWMHLWTVKTR